MEEILQSIKRIIAEEGETQPVEEDILELTDVVSETTADGDDILNTIDEAVAAPPPAPVREPEIASAVPASNNVDDLFPAEPLLPAAEKPSAEPERAPQREDSLLSPRTVEATSATIRTLMDTMHRAPQTPPSLPETFRSGNTVEDLVIELLRPMMRDWLENNLPNLVQRLVEREIKKIIPS